VSLENEPGGEQTVSFLQMPDEKETEYGTE